MKISSTIVYKYLSSKYQKKKRKKEIKALAGDCVECPICGAKFKNFAQFGIVSRENALCLACGSLERHRLLWKFFREKTDVFNPDNNIKLLHFGPEKAFYNAFSAAANIEYLPCDLFPALYKYKGGAKILKVDISQIPFNSNSIDVIVCNHVLEHIPDDALAIQELYRVMKPGGWGIFQVPISGWGYFPKDIDTIRPISHEDSSIQSAEGREKAFGQSDHVRLYGNDYKLRLEAAGFEVEENTFVETFTNEDAFKFGLKRSEKIFLCRKKEESEENN